MDSAAVLNEALRRLLPQARPRIQPWIRETPIELSPYFSEKLGTQLVLKLEQTQHSGSFKVRGAFNKVLAAGERGDVRDLLTASSGNHGLAVAHVAQSLRRKVEVIVPETVSPYKYQLLTGVAQVQRLGVGGETLSRARAAAASQNRFYVPPYNDLEVIASQATLGAELMLQDPGIEVIFASVGGGGLVCGVAAGAKAVSPDVKVIGVCAENAATFYHSYLAKRFTPGPEFATISDGTASALEAGSVTIPLASLLVDEMLLVPEASIIQCMRELAERERWLVEGAAALALAGPSFFPHLSNHSKVAVILCGRTIDPRKLYN